MEDKPRYSRISDLMHLIFLMSSRFDGVTVLDIQQEFNVSRRTAERMRDAIMNILPQVDEIETNDRQKHWGFIDFSTSHLVSFTPEEIASLEKLKTSQDDATNNDIKQITTKIKALSNKKRDLNESVELLLQSEGLAVKQSPNFKIDLGVLSIIREGIKSGRKIRAKYNDKEKLLSPLGIIYGSKVYLVAKEEDKGDNPYHYKMHILKDVTLTDIPFDKKDFDLKAFSEQSFGIYQGEVFNVKLEFKKEVAEDVLNYNFHPTQKMKQLENGNVVVTFKASGDLHILWHIFTWGNNVKILAPASLKKEYKEYLQEVLKEL